MVIKRIMMIILPFLFHMRLGGGIPLDSQTKVIRPPTVTVREDTSSEPRILGGTEMSERETILHILLKCERNHFKRASILPSKTYPKH